MSSITALDRSFTNRIASSSKLLHHFIAAEKQCFHTVCYILCCLGVKRLAYDKRRSSGTKGLTGNYRIDF